MKLHRASASVANSIRRTQVTEVNGILIVIVDTCQRAVLSEVIIGRIPHLSDGVVRVADATVNLPLVIFPEALVCLPAKFASGVIFATIDGRLEVRREVVTYLLILEKRQG